MWPYLVKVILQLALGVLGLRNPLVEADVDFTALFTHVIGGLLEDSINQGSELHGALAFSLGLQDVGIGKVLPVLWAY